MGCDLLSGNARETLQIWRYNFGVTTLVLQLWRYNSECCNAYNMDSYYWRGRYDFLTPVMRHHSSFSATGSRVNLSS